MYDAGTYTPASHYSISAPNSLSGSTYYSNVAPPLAPTQSLHIHIGVQDIAISLPQHARTLTQAEDAALWAAMRDSATLIRKGRLKS